MIQQRDLGTSLSGHLHETPPLPDHVVRGALEQVGRTRQRRRWLLAPTARRPGAQSHRSRPALTALGAMALVAVVAIGLTIPALNSPRISGAGSPALAWAPVQLDFEPAYEVDLSYSDGRFRMTDAEGELRESTDGRSWSRATSDSLQPSGSGGRWRFGASNSLDGFEPDGTTWSHSFRGPISQVAVSPAGFVVIENVTRRHVVEDVLGPAVAAGDWRFVEKASVADPERPDWGDQAVWRIETPTGDVVDVRLADHGYGGVARDDAHVATLGWHSSDGQTWTPIRTATLSWDDTILGTEEGFWWRHGNDDVASIWFSADSQTWSHRTSTTSYEMEPWHGGVVTRNGQSIVFADAAGARELPLPSGIISEESSLRTGLRAGPLGLVWRDGSQGVVAFSADGESWSVADMPADWTKPDAWARGVVVGEAAVLAWVHRCQPGGGPSPGCLHDPLERQLWVGSLADRSPADAGSGGVR